MVLKDLIEDAEAEPAKEPIVEATVSETKSEPVLEPLFPDAPVRARKPTGTGRRGPRSRKSQVDVRMFSLQLVGVHKLLATVTNQPALEIEKDESEQLAKALADIIEEYSLSASRRALLWGNLIVVLVMMYGTRIYVIRQQIAASKPKPAPKMPKQPPAPSNPDIVSNFPPGFKVNLQ